MYVVGLLAHTAEGMVASAAGGLLASTAGGLAAHARAASHSKSEVGKKERLV